MIQQLLGPVVNLVGRGGYGAWTIGSWFFLKYSNLVILVLVALLFLLGVFLQLPTGDETGPARDAGQEHEPAGKPQ